MVVFRGILWDDQPVSSNMAGWKNPPTEWRCLAWEIIDRWSIFHPAMFDYCRVPSGGVYEMESEHLFTGASWRITHVRHFVTVILRLLSFHRAQCAAP